MKDLTPQEETLKLIAAELGLVVLGEIKDEEKPVREIIPLKKKPSSALPSKPYSQLT